MPKRTSKIDRVIEAFEQEIATHAAQAVILQRAIDKLKEAQSQKPKVRKAAKAPTQE